MYKFSPPQPVAVVALGKKKDGEQLEHNFKKHPVLLIGGGSSSGKSNLLQNIICTLISAHKPSELKLALIDLKNVEFIFYKKLPHLFSPVADSLTDANTLLEKLIIEIDRRIAGKIDQPFLLILIDEFADLSLNNMALFENFVQRVAKNGAKVGIGLAISTSHLTPKVITDKIGCAVGSRIGLAVASDSDSRTIIKQNGCCELDKKGEGLYLSGSNMKAEPFQSALITDDEITNCVEMSFLSDI